jgi:hypothetical protein
MIETIENRYLCFLWKFCCKAFAFRGGSFMPKTRTADGRHGVFVSNTTHNKLLRRAQSLNYFCNLEIGARPAPVVRLANNDPPHPDPSSISDKEAKTSP